MPPSSSFAELGEVPAKIVVDEDDVRVQHVTPDAGETYTWQTGAYPALVVDLDLETEPLTGLVYLEPGSRTRSPPNPPRPPATTWLSCDYFSR